jgi:hypothetical protein
MKNFWCEKCDYRWQCTESETTYQKECPRCGEKHDIRLTMSLEEAKLRGIIS